MSDFWRTLGERGFSSAEAAAIEQVFSVGALVDHFVPLMRNVVQGFASGTYQTLPDLARLSLQDWIALVDRTGTPPHVDAAETASPAQAFARAVYTRVTRAYPTAALSSRIAGGNFVPQAQQQPLAQFFRDNPGLDLIEHNIPAFLSEKGDKAFEHIAPEDRAAVGANLRRLQRVLRLTPHPDAAQALLAQDIHSATQIAALGRQQFARKAAAAGLSETEADHVFEAAARRYAGVVSLYTQFNRDAIGVLPKATGRGLNGNEAVRQAIARDPSLATLFGSQDYCATDFCTSILSPAAYLCDLLLWLHNHKLTEDTGIPTALDVLIRRRPDIQYLLLNCPNTDTELPYIDLVNELLADRITSTTLASAIGTATQTSITVASYAGFPPPPFFTKIGAETMRVTAVGGPGNTTWTVERALDYDKTPECYGTGCAVTMTGPPGKQQQGKNPRWKQTSADLTTAELCAAPEYFNQAAYVVLAGASYPFTLPYSAGLDLLRTCLRQWKLPLWQLRLALILSPSGSPGTSRHLLGERFGMAPHAYDLVTKPNLVPAAVAWNTANPATDLAKVPAFLRAAGITYESLLELLQVK
jgi:hypothetical protein